MRKASRQVPRLPMLLSLVVSKWNAQSGGGSIESETSRTKSLQHREVYDRESQEVKQDTGIAF